MGREKEREIREKLTGRGREKYRAVVLPTRAFIG